jgi:glycosyltransferase 2 family protein
LPGGPRPWITCLSLGFLLAALLGHGRRMLQLSIDAQGWLWLLLAVGVAALSLVVNGWAWGVVLGWRGLEPRWAELIGLHVATNLRKYLPAGIWHLSARLQALRGPQAPLRRGSTATAPALVVTLLDPLLAAVAALALLPLGGWQKGLAGLGLLPLLGLRSRWLEPLLQALERQRARRLGVAEQLEREQATLPTPTRDPGYPWQPLLAELVFVLLRFAAFACCVSAFDLQLSLGWGSWLAGFALAWTAGLLVPGAPGGLGVFEAVLLLRLSVLLPQASLLAVALSYRLVVTLADLLAAGLVSLDQRWAAALASSGAAASPASGDRPG